MKISILSAAQDEHLAQVEFYNRCQPGLGAEYHAEFSAAINRIARSPKHFPAMHAQPYRRCVLQRFPFTIIFRQATDMIVVVAIAAQRRRPEYWLQR